jgi:hypothetical protein
MRAMANEGRQAGQGSDLAGRRQDRQHRDQLKRRFTERTDALIRVHGERVRLGLYCKHSNTANLIAISDLAVTPRAAHSEAR